MTGVQTCALPIPFVAVMVLGLAIVMAFPDLALWLPSYVYGR